MTEIAFFGGSFTAIDREYMLSLLDATKPYIDRFYGIRISTRPDCIDEEVLDILKSYKVTAIELGAQSMDDKVLLMNERGHSSDDVRRASELIKSYGFELGLQMMTGLYGSSDDLDRYTAREFIRLSPDTVRIYPTIVMKGTRLGELYEAGEYRPQTKDEAVELCSELLLMFEDRGIPVIRMGLHDSESLRRDMLAGPHHPAFRELCESRILFEKAVEILKTKKPGIYSVHVPPGSYSKMSGNKKCNVFAFSEMGYQIRVVEDSSLSGREVAVYCLLAYN